MHVPLDDALMHLIGERLGRQLGLAIGPQHWERLRRAIEPVTDACQPPALAACLRRFIDAPLARSDAELIAAELSVGETYFFREPQAFEMLEREVLPALLAERRCIGRRLRLWSAGCCTGEECYSLAIIVNRLLPDIAEWDIRIVGTDIHPGFLAQARKGIYGDWSFRGLSPILRRRYFEALPDERWSVRPALRNGVDFRYGNLAQDAPPGCAFDLVLCRNVLMYFNAEAARRVLATLRESLSPRGWLLVAAAEAPVPAACGLVEARIGDVVFHRRPLGTRP
ncbi:MAG TPA: protein-glutamate O-methyltransferase CheR [Albitalea sp.]|uniref:CheR family methyltransferase n=1 Tax=Piscinibacter sp. TaxID=1903157 RepID=UPI002ED5A3AC